MITYSITFDVVTPEFAEQGDFAETGFLVEDRPLTIDEDETAVDAALRLVRDELGHCEASSSGPLGLGDWLQSADADVDYSDASETRKAVHFTGMTDAEMYALGCRLEAAGLL